MSDVNRAWGALAVCTAGDLLKENLGCAWVSPVGAHAWHLLEQYA